MAHLRAWTRRLAALAAVATLAAPARGQDAPKPDDAIAKIQQSGGKVDRDDKAEGKPVKVVNFATTQVGDDALAPLKDLTTVTKLTLNGTKITDAGLEHLKGLASLRKLYLVDTKVGDKGLEQLKELKDLEVLSLVGTEVTDAGLEQLKGLEKLQELYLYATKVTDEGVKKLKEALPKVRVDK